jgi:hypothetical protein
MMAETSTVFAAAMPGFTIAESAVSVVRIGRG